MYQKLFQAKCSTCFLFKVCKVPVSIQGAFKLKGIITSYKDLLYAMWKPQTHGWCDELYYKLLSHNGWSLSCDATVQCIVQTPSTASISKGLYREIPCNNESTRTRDNLRLPTFPAFWIILEQPPSKRIIFLPPPGFLLRTFYINTCLVELFLAHFWQERLSADVYN